MFIRRVDDEKIAKTSKEDLNTGKNELCVPRKPLDFSSFEDGIKIPR